MDTDGKNDGGAGEARTEAKASENAKEDESVLGQDAKVGGKNGETEKLEGVNKNKDQYAPAPSLPVANGNEMENGKENPSALLVSNGHKKETTAEIETGASSSSSNGREKGSEKHVPPSLVSDKQDKGSGNGEQSSTSGAKDHQESPPMNEEEKGFPLDLNEYEKKAWTELRSMMEHAILKNKIRKEVNKEEANDPTEQKEESQKFVEDHPKQDQQDEASTNEKLEKVDKDISLWGVPMLPTQGDSRTDTLLLKFLRARDFKANEAFEMIRDTLEWRRKNKIDSIVDEDFGNEFNSVCYMKGFGHEGHPICYNLYGAFADGEMYNNIIATEAGRDRFLRWRLQLLEREIGKLDFGPGGVSTLIQVNDLKNAPGLAWKDLRHAIRHTLEILQDNYPEFVARNIFINVPFWYYAFYAILSPFLTQRAKSKFVFSRPGSVTETLLKYIAIEQIPVNCGGLLRDKDLEFSRQDLTSEVIIKASGTNTIEIPTPEVGNAMMWEVTIVGWDVNYKEEFVPTDEESYTVIVKKGRKIGWQEVPIQNAYRNKEPGKVVITIDNGMLKKKRVFYRYKLKNA